MTEKLYEGFTHLFSIKKAIKFELKPTVYTQKTVEDSKLIENDLKRSELSSRVKELADRVHTEHYNSVMSRLVLNSDYLHEYEDLSSIAKPNALTRTRLSEIKKALAGQITGALTAGENFTDEFFKTGLFKKSIPSLSGLTADDLSAVDAFAGFQGYFNDYYTMRENLYSDKTDRGRLMSGSYAGRIIEDNLPKYISNIHAFDKLKDIEGFSDYIAKIKKGLPELGDYEVENFFNLDFYSMFLTQKGIELYNAVLGGKMTDDPAETVLGLNNYIALYNQTTQDARLPKLKRLDKQPLAERETLSFRTGGYSSDRDVIEAVFGYFTDGLLDSIESSFKTWMDCDTDAVFIPGKNLNLISYEAYGSWRILETKIKKKFREEQPKPFRTEELARKAEDKYLKGRTSFSLSELSTVSGNDDIMDYLKVQPKACMNSVRRYLDMFREQTLEYDLNDDKKKLPNDPKAVESLKLLLDNANNLLRLSKIIDLPEEGEYTDQNFYESLAACREMLSPVNSIYQKTRNYVTSKPYSLDHIRLYFDTPTFLGGFDVSNEPSYRSTILRKDGQEYIAVLLDKDAFNVPTCSDEEEHYGKMVYKQIPNAAKYLSMKQIKMVDPPEEFVRIYDKKKSKAPLTEAELDYYIEFLKDGFLANYGPIQDADGNCYFNFDFRDKYQTLDEFYKDVEAQAYSVRFDNIPASRVEELDREGRILLFTLYNKDYSDKHKSSRDNLNTLYWKQFLSEENLRKKGGVPVRLCGGAEMFWRDASVSLDGENARHGQHHLQKKTGTGKELVYIKDRRFTEPKYHIHLLLSMNSECEDVSKLNQGIMNDAANLAIQRHSCNVLAVSRGVDSLVTYCVLAQDGMVLERGNFDKINNTDYCRKIKDAVIKMSEEKKSWKSETAIKDLTKGYLSYVIHEVCRLMEKYNAPVFMENLTNDMMKMAQLQKNVYGDFQNNLITKLSYLVDKDIAVGGDSSAQGGVANAYQLAFPVKSDYIQNGMVFRISSWKTRNIDPVTGFTSRFVFTQNTKESRLSFLKKFKKIGYSEEKGYFEFSFDYKDFNGGDSECWTMASVGLRTRAYKNPDSQQWSDILTDSTQLLKDLFYEKNIELSENMLMDIEKADDNDLYTRLIAAIKNISQLEYRDENGAGRFILSPVCGRHGIFYDGRKEHLSADDNGAYNLARRGILVIRKIQEDRRNAKGFVDCFVNGEEWLDAAKNWN